jgi:hypothetical protein
MAGMAGNVHLISPIGSSRNLKNAFARGFASKAFLYLLYWAFCGLKSCRALGCVFGENALEYIIQ